MAGPGDPLLAKRTPPPMLGSASRDDYRQWLLPREPISQRDPTWSGPFGRLARLLLRYSTTICNAGGLCMGWLWALAIWLAIGLGFGLGWSIAWRTVRRGMRRSP